MEVAFFLVGIEDLFFSFGIRQITLDLTITTVDVSISTDAYTITANEADGEYQWVDCGDDFAIIPGATEQSYTASENGNYAVIVTLDDCLDTSDFVMINGLGVAEYYMGSKVSIYPNPTTGDFTIELRDHLDAVITIFDVAGKMAYKQSKTNGAIIEIDAKEFSNGLYYVVIEYKNNEQEVVKFVKQ